MKYVEMFRSLPAYQANAGIIPSTLEKFYEDDVTVIFWSTYGQMFFDEVGTGYASYPFRAYGDTALRAYMPASGFGTWSGNYAAIGLARANDDTEENQQIAFSFGARLLSFTELNSSLLAILRGSGTAASPTFYAVKRELDTFAHKFTIVKVVAGVESALSTSFTISSSIVFGVIRFEIIESAGDYILRFRVWDAENPEPDTWDRSVTETTPIASGDFKGIGYRKNTQNIDNKWLEFISIGTGGDQAPIPRTLKKRRAYFNESGSTSVIAGLLGVLGDDGASGITAYAAVSTHDFRTEEGDVPPNTAFEDIITDIGDFERRVDDQLAGAASLSFGDLTLLNSSGALDHWNNYNWDGRDYRLYIGGLDAGTGVPWPWWDFELFNKGTIANISWSGPQKLVVKLNDPAALLDRQIQTTRYEKTEYTDWPQATVGRLKPLVFGRVFNIRPICIDEVTHRYQVHDGALDYLHDVRENGSSIMGSVTLDLANGGFYLAASPAGDLSCDAENLGPYDMYDLQDGSTAIQAATVVQGIARILAMRSSLALDQRNENAEDALSFPYAVNLGVNQEYGGVFIDNEMKFNEALDQLVLSNGMTRFFNRLGRLSIVRFDLDYNIFASDILAYHLTEDEIIERSLVPVQRVLPCAVEHIYANKNYFQQTNIAGSVTDENLRALYAQQGVLSSYVPSESGLDTPSKHLLHRERPARMTLLSQDGPAAGADAADYEAQRLWTLFSKQVMIFEFQTRAFAMEIEPGQYLKITHDRWGLGSGVVGQVAGVRANPMTRVAKVLWAVKRNGAWPVVTANYPYLSESDFGH